MKNGLGIYKSKLALQSNLADLKTGVDKIGLDKLKTYLSKLSNVVNNDVLKETVHDKSVAKANNINISGFVLKTKYDADKSELEKKIRDITRRAKKTIKTIMLDY